METSAEKIEADGAQAAGQELYEWVRALVSAVTAVVLVFTFAVRMIGVDGHSMVPTLQNGDRLAVTAGLLAGTYRPGDIVVLRKDSFLDEPIVKRVIAVGGQTVDIDFSTGSVFLDGKLLNEPYINELTFREEPAARLGDCVENASAEPEIVIRGNHFGPSMGRGILCTSRGRTVIEDNVFYRTGGVHRSLLPLPPPELPLSGAGAMTTGVSRREEEAAKYRSFST